MSSMLTRAIIHIDGDAFFAACEIARNPSLIGKPVVVGREKGIATAMSYEAKARGITRAMPIFQVRQVCPEAVIVPSDFTLYRAIAARMYVIMCRFTPYVEEYSIDECFADITHCVEDKNEEGYRAFAEKIQNTLCKELGITYSVGVAETKVLAKIASKRCKPRGLTVLGTREAQKFIHTLPIGAVWGIGHSTIPKMRAVGVVTAGDFVNLPEARVKEIFNRPQWEIWQELQGISVLDAPRQTKELQQSIQHTRMFPKKLGRREDLLRELSYHAEEVCARARAAGLVGSTLHAFLKTTTMEYRRFEMSMPHATASPRDLITHISGHFSEWYIPSLIYRAAGVTLGKLKPVSHRETDLFGHTTTRIAFEEVLSITDILSKKYGNTVVSLASSLGHSTDREEESKKLARLPLPFLGDVS